MSLRRRLMTPGSLLANTELGSSNVAQRSLCYFGGRDKISDLRLYSFIELGNFLLLFHLSYLRFLGFILSCELSFSVFNFSTMLLTCENLGYLLTMSRNLFPTICLIPYIVFVVNYCLQLTFFFKINHFIITKVRS